MSTRTVAQLDQFLDRSLSWRKRELTLLKFAVDTAPPLEQRVLLRAGAALLYAHWEGFVKEAGTSYLELISNQGLNLDQLQPQFVALSIGIRARIRKCGATDKVSIHKGLIEALTSGIGAPARVACKGVVQTRSNLKASTFKEIIDTLGLDYTPFAAGAKPVIDRLLTLRNSVAHGQGRPVERTDYEALHLGVVGFLERFRVQIQDAASMKKYLV